jgi:gamma-carbonic anhydrase
MPVFALNGITPQIAADAFIAPGTQIIGDVTIGAGSSVWFNCVLRGDGNFIRIGERTNIQDGSVVHITTQRHGTIIGNDVLIGHMALVHGCTLEDNCFVGLGSIVMDGCVIESHGMLAAGAMLTPGKRIGTRQLWGGRPARYMRDLTDADLASNRVGTDSYTQLAQKYRVQLKPIS